MAFEQKMICNLNVGELITTLEQNQIPSPLVGEGQGRGGQD
jgi:hypothetical protein